MDCTQDLSSDKPPLPPNFKTIEEIRNIQLTPGNNILVDVIAFIKDYRMPKKSGGTDYKCTLEIVDPSIPSDVQGMQVNVFWPEENTLPTVTESNSFVVIRKCRVQERNSAISLIANKFSTEFHILPSSKLPPGPTTIALPWRVFSRKPNPISPTSIELAYVLWLNGKREIISLPSEMEFQNRVTQSTNAREKFAQLKDVKPDYYYDILGEVVKIYDSGHEHLSVYLTDYTTNSKFYNYVWGDEIEDSYVRDGDAYGYLKPAKKEANKWPGPFGKRSIQLTLWDPHAAFFRQHVKIGDWVLLSNVSIKYGKNNVSLLEGFLRLDRSAHDGKVQVKIMTQSENNEDNDPRWKEAVRRKLEWWKAFNSQKKDLLDEAAGSSTKRKVNENEPCKTNSKRRRQEARAAIQQKNAIPEPKPIQQVVQVSDLNENIKCYNQEKPVTHVKDILKPELFRSPEDGREYEAPFTIRKYRANVRVIDYYPPRIEDFAVGRRASEMDLLSDYSGGEDTDREGDMILFKTGKGFARNIWEWRFELLVEDKDPSSEKEQLWLSVNNLTAQGLLEEDASSLRGDPELLGRVKEQLFKLWGDLEEQKAIQHAYHQLNKKSTQESPPSSFASFASLPHPKVGAQPDTDSDDETSPTKIAQSASGEIIRDPKAMSKGDTPPQSTPKIAPKNKAFACCIRQYGILVDEPDEEKANAGDGKRWQRKFGLFDTFCRS